MTEPAAEPNPSSLEPTPTPTDPGSGTPIPANTLHRVASRLGGFSKGDLAELRRLDPRRGHASAGPAFWRLATEILEADGFLRREGSEELRGWMAVIQGLAVLGELHRQGERLGTAMADAKISEARLTRLLQARGDALLTQIRPLAHQLRSEAVAADWREVARLVLGAENNADEVRYHIASAYYRQHAKASAKTSTSTE